LGKNGVFLYRIYAIPVALGLIVVLAEGLLFVVSAAVAIVRAVSWRVAEYDKGAWAALVLITTILLGVFELAYKTMK
jgi:hypothetical protein